MRSTNALIWRNLTAHPLRSILTALAITLGVGMVLAAAIVGQAANQSVAQMSGDGPQIDLEILARDEAAFDTAVLTTLRAHPDIAHISPALRVEAQATNPDIPQLTLLGVEPGIYQTLYQPQLANGAFLDQPNSIVLPMAIALKHGLNTGDAITITLPPSSFIPSASSGQALHPSSFSLTVAGRLRIESEGMSVGQETVAFVQLDTAQSLAGVPEQIDHIALTLNPGAEPAQVKEDLSAQLGPSLLLVQTSGSEGSSFNTLFIQGGLVMVGMIMLFAATFVIMNAFAMSVTARTQEIGALRALGMTRRQVMRQVLAEASILGLSGAALGVPTGIGLAWLVMVIRNTLDEGGLVVPWWGAVLAVVMGLATTWVGALLPARQASHVSPLVAMRSRSRAEVAESWPVQQSGRVGGIALPLWLLILMVVAFAWKPDFIWSGVLLGAGIAGLLLITLLLMPALVNPVARLARPLLARWLGTAGRLAADNLARNKRRTVLTAAALTIGLTTIIGSSGLLTASLKGGLNGFFGLFNEDGMIIPDIPALMASGELTAENSLEMLAAGNPLDPALLEAIVNSGIVHTNPYGFAPVPDELSTLPGAPGAFIVPEIYIPMGNFDFFEGDAGSALALLERGRAMLLVPMTAARLGVSVGDTIPVQTRQGEVTFTVAGIGGNSTNFTVFSYADGQTYFGLGEPSWLGLMAPEGEDIDTVLAQIEEIMAPFEDVAVFDMRGEDVGGMLKIVGQIQSLLNTLLLLAVVVAALGVVNTMVINVSERGREIGLLRAVGATQQQVRQAVIAEAATLGLMSALIAAGLGLFMLLLFVIVFSPGGAESVGIRANWELAGKTLMPALRDMGLASLLSLLFGPLVAAVAAYYPARQAAATNIVEATRSERLSLKRRGEVERPQSRRRLTRSLTWTMAWRNLEEGRLCTILSISAIALGVAMIIAADVIANAAREAIQTADERNLGAIISEVTDLSLTIVGIVILIAAGFLIFNAFGMAIAQRRRQIGTLRSLGMIRRQIMQLVLVEAMITGGAGVILGLVGGPLLGQGLINLLQIVGDALGTTLVALGTGHVSFSVLIIAGILGLGITLFATLIPARQATRISPLEALQQQQEATKETWFFGKTGFLSLALIFILSVYLAIAPPGEWAMPPWNTILAGSFGLLWLACLGLLLPSLIRLVSQAARTPLSRLWGATGRLIADNLGRSRRRVTLTILTLAVGLATITAVTGSMTFMFTVLIDHMTADAFDRGGWIILPIDFGKSEVIDVVTTFDVDTMYLPPPAVAEIQGAIDGKADRLDLYMVNVPELAFFPGSFSYVLDQRQVEQYGDMLFDFSEGDWESARPIMEDGCGVLVAPAIAYRNGVGLGETFTVTGPDGPVNCTVAGIGRSSLANVSTISLAAADTFRIDHIPGMIVSLRPGTDPVALDGELRAILARYPGMSLYDLSFGTEVLDFFDTTATVMNTMLLLVIVTAALGVVNTTVMAIGERRRELGLLRAVGATRRQVTAVVTGEAALMGLAGGLLGLVAGVGLTAIFAVTYGGNAWGIPDLPLWPSAWQAMRPTLFNGLFGLLVAPLVSAGAAWFPVRGSLRGTAIETMQPARPETISTQRAVVGFLGRGSIRARFVVGTAVLMLVVLAGLINVVVAHARTRLDEQMLDALHTMVAVNASMLALGLPAGTQNLDLETIQAGQPFGFDAETLLRFESVAGDMSQQGVAGFAITDRDDVVLISLNMRQIGTVAAPLATADSAHAYSEREDDEWLMYAAAPIRNSEGDRVGSVRLTADPDTITDFLDKLSSRLWGIGGAIVLVGLLVSWWLSTPLVRTTQQLAAHASGVSRGEYRLFSQPSRRIPSPNLSLRTRLTVAMVLIMALMVGVLELVTVPTERKHVEETLQNGLVAGAEWLGQMASDSLGEGLGGFSLSQLLAMEDGFAMAELLHPAQMQTLMEEARGNDIAYSAVLDADGSIIFSDQLAMVGEKTAVSTSTTLEEAEWRDEAIWRITTPLRQGRDGAQIGGWQLGVRRAGVETFLDESHNLFRLAGLIAVLAGVLMAQAIGGAVTAPVRQLTAVTQRVAQGDLSVHFKVNSRDELAMLAHAYNQMVVGLQEREWLKDMFGRFVSQEVAEALRTGQVRLEGENRVVSILFCDIRGFTARSEQHTPQEIVALLNEYLPVVVDAAQQHDGTVNKFGGDSTLVIYGAPKTLSESAYHAVRTALEMRRNLAQLNQKLAQRGETPIRIGVGINTGTVLAGAVGTPERQEYTVIGDTVNLASRIESLNKEYPEYDILISGQTYEALAGRRGEFELADLGQVPIRGKVEPVRVWAVLG